jgi:hypothetical protein
MNNPEKEITDKQSDFLEALLGEARGNIRAAMDIAGYSKMTKTSEVVSSLREEITERAGLMLAMNAPKAALLRQKAFLVSFVLRHIQFCLLRCSGLC